MQSPPFNSNRHLPSHNNPPRTSNPDYRTLSTQALNLTNVIYSKYLVVRDLVFPEPLHRFQSSWLTASYQALIDAQSVLRTPIKSGVFTQWSTVEWYTKVFPRVLTRALTKEHLRTIIACMEKLAAQFEVLLEMSRESVGRWRRMGTAGR